MSVKKWYLESPRLFPFVQWLRRKRTVGARPRVRTTRRERRIAYRVASGKRYRWGHISRFRAHGWGWTVAFYGNPNRNPLLAVGHSTQGWLVMTRRRQWVTPRVAQPPAGKFPPKGD